VVNWHRLHLQLLTRFVYPSIARVHARSLMQEQDPHHHQQQQQQQEQDPQQTARVDYGYVGVNEAGLQWTARASNAIGSSTMSPAQIASKTSKLGEIPPALLLEFHKLRCHSCRNENGAIIVTRET